MKNIALLLTICISFISCDKSNDISPETINTDFNTKILDGYFIKSIAFDKQGNAWIGTFKQGLIKYNYSGFTIYNSKNSIISDTSVIYDLAIDNKNNVWIACEGLIKYDGINFTHYNSLNTPMPEDFVSSIDIDSKDNIWFSSSRFRQGGVVKYNGTDWTVYTPDNSDLPVNFVQSIAIDVDDNVWLALNEIVNDSYLAKVSNDKWTIYTSSELGFTPYYFGNIQIDSKNRLCGAIDYSLSSTFYNNGTQVFIFNGKTSESLKFDNSTNVKFLTVDKNDNIWCGMYGGYAVFNGDKWVVEDSRFLKDGVFAIEQSNDNKIWIGTGNGIYINE
jgi:ligand-binding sensor domain-containing protein